MHLAHLAVKPTYHLFCYVVVVSVVVVAVFVVVVAVSVVVVVDAVVAVC